MARKPETQPIVDPLKEDFRIFLYAVWKHLRLPDPTPAQYDMAHFLQHGPRRKMLMAFRGVGKSWITSAYVVWLLYRNPQAKILVVSATKSRADDFSMFVMRLIMEMDILAHLRPRDDQRQSKIAFDVAPARADHSPSVKSVGITGQLTGTRADYIVADDIEIPNNSDTHTAREKLAESVKEFDAVLKQNGEVTYLGTPQTELSLYNQLPQRGYVIRVWPARIPHNVDRYGSRLAPMIEDLIEKGVRPGAPVDPKRFDDEDLKERELSYGRSGFALQFMLDTSLSDADRFPLKLSDLIVMALDPQRGPVDLAWSASPDLTWKELPNVGMDGDRLYRPMFISKDWMPYEGSVMFLDPSGRGKDETAICVVKQLNGRMFLTYLAGFKSGYDDKTLMKIVLIAKDQKVNLILVEPNFGDGMFAQLLKAACTKYNYAVSVEDAEWSRTQKEARIIDTLEPVMNSHRLVVDAAIVDYDYKSTETYIPEEQQRYRLFYQMTRITKDRGALLADDRIDALAGAVRYWVDSMAKETGKAARDSKASILDQELEKFMEGARKHFKEDGGGSSMTRYQKSLGVFKK